MKDTDTEIPINAKSIEDQNDIENGAIIVKAFKKAFQNGMTECTGLYHKQLFRLASFDDELIASYFTTGAKYMAMIFSQEFAKAFWGEETEIINECPKCKNEYLYVKYDNRIYCERDGRKLVQVTRASYDQEWKDRLQEMVLEEEPIKYLEQFLD